VSFVGDFEGRGGREERELGREGSREGGVESDGEGVEGKGWRVMKREGWRGRGGE
jgi:hypothetical protein